jgi:hypothetical protein
VALPHRDPRTLRAPRTKLNIAGTAIAAKIVAAELRKR